MSVDDVLARFYREEHSRLLAALVARFGDLDLAEESAQEAMAAAMASWPSSGVPANPLAWLITTARRKALDRVRRDAVLARRLAELAVDADRGLADATDADAGSQVADERLAMLMGCCHPAIAPADRIALMLRFVAGLTSAEVAQALLLPLPTLQARITRAKRRIAVNRIPLRVPDDPGEIERRLPLILTAISLIFTEGYDATAGANTLRADLTDEAVRLARILADLVPGRAEPLGLLGLLLLTDARHRARVDPDGVPVALEDQDRTRWDRELIAEGIGIVERAAAMPDAGPFTTRAAIAAVHSEAETFADTDWRQIVALYDLLLRHVPDPVAAMNRAIAVGRRDTPQVGLDLLEAMADEPTLVGHHPYHVALALFRTECGDPVGARQAWLRARNLVDNQAQRSFIDRHLAPEARSTDSGDFQKFDSCMLNFLGPPLGPRDVDFTPGGPPEGGSFPEKDGPPMTAVESTAPGSTGTHPKTPHAGLLIGALVISAMVMILNETILSVALPAIMADFAVGADLAQWLTTGFMLTMAVVIPTTGFLMQRFTTRTLFLAALAFFTAGTLVAAVAPTFTVLLIARVVQAIGTAMIMPLLMTVALTVVAPERRGVMMGIISVVISVAPAIGPTLSGIILSTFTWHWLFWMMLPISLICLVVGGLVIRNVSETRPAPFDVVSVILSALGFGGLVYGLSSLGAMLAGGSLIPVSALVVGALALAAFVHRQIVLQRTDRALLSMQPFRSRTFTLSVITVVGVFGTMLGTVIVLPIYLQQTLLLSAMTTGMLMLPGGLLQAALSPFIGRLYDRIGPRPIAVPGAALMLAAQIALFLGLNESTSIGFVIAVHITFSIGMALVMTPLMTASLASLPMREYGHGSAIMNTLQQLGGAAGTAALIAAMTLGGTVAPAFVVGISVVTVALIAALFIRQPARS